jgi:hypothetical protein
LQQPPNAGTWIFAEGGIVIVPVKEHPLSTTISPSALQEIGEPDGVQAIDAKTDLYTIWYTRSGEQA